MRHWVFHPLAFFPLAAIVAAAVIAVSLRPQAWPREPAPVAGMIAEGALVLEGEGFTSPDSGPEQAITVTRDFWGRAQTLRIAQLPGRPSPTPAELGARIVLTPESAAFLDAKPVVVEVSYNPLPINAASGLAVSLQGVGPAEWVSAPLEPAAGVVRFELPAHVATNAIGLRALSEGTDQAYGVEILRIRATPAS